MSSGNTSAAHPQDLRDDASGDQWVNSLPPPVAGLLTIRSNLPSIADVIRPRSFSALRTALLLATTAVPLGAGAPVQAADAPAPTSSAPTSSPPAASRVSATAPPAPPPGAAARPAGTASTAVASPASAPSPTEGAGSAATFGVVGIGPASLPPTLAAQLDSAAAAGLAASGATVVGRALTARPAGSCDGPTCLQQVARASGARYLLRGTCVIEGSTYRVHLDLVDGSTGAVALSRKDTCEICTEHDVVEATNIAASALKATFDRTARPVPVAVAVAPRPPASVDLRSGHDHADRGPPLWLRAAPWVAFAVAAGAIGTGAYYLSRNGEPTDCGSLDGKKDVCPNLYSTGLRSGLWLGGGALAGALGVLALTLTPSSPARAATKSGTSGPQHAQLARPVGLTLSPSGVSAWTRF